MSYNIVYLCHTICLSICQQYVYNMSIMCTICLSMSVYNNVYLCHTICLSMSVYNMSINVCIQYCLSMSYNIVYLCQQYVYQSVHTYCLSLSYNIVYLCQQYVYQCLYTILSISVIQYVYNVNNMSIMSINMST